LYRVGFERANLLKMSLVTTAAMLAICLLTLVETTNTAEATSLPRNGKIAFSSYRDNNFDIYVMNADGTDLKRLTNVTRGLGAQFAWSPDGKKIAFEAADGVYVMNADGSDLRNLHLHSNRSEADYIHHTWSPDGTKMAFSSGRPPDFIHDIYTMNLDGSNQINLTNTPGLNEMHPNFSPDGSQICFSRDSHGKPKPPSGIYLMDADGTDPTLLIEEVGQGQCDWSPDGTKIAFNRGVGVHDNPDVFVMNADGSGQTNLTRSKSEMDVNPDWSPDGTRITFESYRDGAYPDIYTMDPDGSDVAQLTANSDVNDMDPNWQPLPRPTIHPPDTGGPSLLLVGSALLFSVGSLLYAMVRRRM
jgi:TolB protein